MEDQDFEEIKPKEKEEELKPLSKKERLTKRLGEQIVKQKYFKNFLELKERGEEEIELISYLYPSMKKEEFFKKELLQLKEDFLDREIREAEAIQPETAWGQTFTRLLGKPLRGNIKDGFVHYVGSIRGLLSLARDSGEQRTNIEEFGKKIEWVVVDKERDKNLTDLCQWAQKLKEEIPDEEERIFHIVKKVFEKMGDNESEKIRKTIKERTEYTGEKKEAILLGEINYGVCRHRALLTQILAAESGLEEILLRGGWVESIRLLGGHAWNELKLRNGEIIVVDASWPMEDIEKMGYEEFKNKGGFPRFGSNRLPFSIYKDDLEQFCGGQLGAEGLSKLLEKTNE